MKNQYCEDCIFCELVDWKTDAKGHAKPIYWCEKENTFCKEVKECKKRIK